MNIFNPKFNSLLSVTLLISIYSHAQENYITTSGGKSDLSIVSNGKATTIFTTDQEHSGVMRVINFLQEDIERVTEVKPQLSKSTPDTKEAIIVGTLGKNELLDKLISSKKIDVSSIRNKWEAFIIQVVHKPLPGVDKALIIVGSDKRGTIFGVLDVSEKMGVSPWYWWADVPVQHKSNIAVKSGTYYTSAPSVKYRGIFINDEAPALSGWAQEKFGGFNSKFYDKVFELILRMKGNFLWPAMWGRAIYDDDPQSPILANEYGIVISTSHHEPMMRAHVEWDRYGKGEWNYEKNEAFLKEFWKEGITRMGTNESVVTLAMRGDGDKAMSQETNISLLEKIVKDQRDILTSVTGKEITTIPQVWALYKEVQDYYDQGMRVPDDVTLLLCDDNWGNIRKLPKPGDNKRSGGHGIYYHFDYVGGPRNYKWLNTTQISRVWEQMHLAYEHGVDRIWVVNVGDIKPMEFPTQFFLDYAWAPDKLPAEKLPEYTINWARKQFGEKYASDIAHVVTKYSQFNSRRKPELLAPGTYSLIDYKEAETIVKEYNDLLKKAETIGASLNKEYQDAYFQLVLHPVKACANLNELYYTVAKNRLYAEQGRAITNDLAERVKELFKRDAEISDYYNTKVANGKWSHMMDQTHIGYTYWQQPPKDVMPDVKEINLENKSEMGVSIEGSVSWWPLEKAEAVLPMFDQFNKQEYHVDLFNRGSKSFDYKVETSEKWLVVSHNNGTVDKEQRLNVTVDWKAAPKQNASGFITIEANGQTATIKATIHNLNATTGFVESNGYVSIEAEHFSKAVSSPEIKWQKIPELGRTLSAISTSPTTASRTEPSGNSPRLEYEINLTESGDYQIDVLMSPTLDYYNDKVTQYAISIDDDKPQLVNIHSDESLKTWEQWVANNINVTSSTHHIEKAGQHTLKFWMVDSGVVLQKIIIYKGSLKPSYLGPPESFRIAK